MSPQNLGMVQRLGAWTQATRCNQSSQSSPVLRNICGLCPQPTLGVTGDVEKCLVQPLQAFLRDLQSGGHFVWRWTRTSKMKINLQIYEKLIYDPDIHQIYSICHRRVLAWHPLLLQTGNVHAIGSNVSPPGGHVSMKCNQLHPTGWAVERFVESHDMAILHSSGTFRNYPQKHKFLQLTLQNYQACRSSNLGPMAPT